MTRQSRSTACGATAAGINATVGPETSHVSGATRSTGSPPATLRSRLKTSFVRDDGELGDTTMRVVAGVRLNPSLRTWTLPAEQAVLTLSQIGEVATVHSDCCALQALSQMG